MLDINGSHRRGGFKVTLILNTRFNTAEENNNLIELTIDQLIRRLYPNCPNQRNECVKMLASRLDSMATMKTQSV